LLLSCVGGAAAQSAPSSIYRNRVQNLIPEAGSRRGPNVKPELESAGNGFRFDLTNITKFRTIKQIYGSGTLRFILPSGSKAADLLLGGVASVN
jgi:hypothetical protein